MIMDMNLTIVEFKDTFLCQPSLMQNNMNLTIVEFKVQISDRNNIK